MRSRDRYSVPLIALVVLLCAGCGPSIRVDNKSWAIRDVNELTRMKDGLVDVQVDVRNVAIMKVRFDYCFMWYDSGGFALGDGKPEWKSDTLKSGEGMALKATAPNRDAIKVRVVIKQPETFGSID